ncbi:hypothetical protein ACRRTK_023310 [Alexandromys fortis]
MPQPVVSAIKQNSRMDAAITVLIAKRSSALVVEVECHYAQTSGSNTPQQPDHKVLRGLRNEEAPQEKKAKLHEQTQFQGPSGDLSAPLVEKARSHGLTRQNSIKNGSGGKHPIASDIPSDSVKITPILTL